MNSRRAGFELSAVNNQIFAAGYDERRKLSVETYDLRKKEWSCHMNDLKRDILTSRLNYVTLSSLFCYYSVC